MEFAQISFRGLDPSEFIERRVREKLDWLNRFENGIVGARVTVEQRHKHQHKGALFHVRVYLKVAGGSQVVMGEDEAEDVYVAIRDAFDAVRRGLEGHAGRLRGETKAHEEPPIGRVVSLGADYGFLRTVDDREIYFHRNALPDGGFDDLALGDAVRFDLYEGEGNEGPQASTVFAVRAPMPV